MFNGSTGTFILSNVSLIVLEIAIHLFILVMYVFHELSTAIS